jgi:hypothetical protein
MSEVSNRDDAFEKALEYVADPDRLLPGEEPKSRHPDDARHWASVYGELLHFKEQLVATARRAGEGMRGSAKPEVNEDLALLEAERSRLRKRYRFWRRELDRVSGRD